MTELADSAHVSAAHERFVTTGRSPGRHVRRVVAESWRRSVRSGVDPEVQNAPVELAGRSLTAYRGALAVADAMPVVRELLVAPGSDAGWVTALSDDAGRLLWVEGDQGVRRQMEPVGFVEGAVWREDCAGTNALGTALEIGQPVQVVGYEHFARKVHPFSCAAVPVHAPSGQVLGVVDVTGGAIVASAVVMSLVRAAVAAVEAELGRLALERTAGGGRLVVRPEGAADAMPALRVLCARPTVRIGSVDVRVSLRHAEILLLLARHPDGLSADELAVLLSEQTISDVTVRAEVSRLRRIVGPLLSESRPYRLTARLRTDIDLVRDLLAGGEVNAALSTYRNRVLARSVAPGVERAREELSTEVRAAILATPEPGPVSRWVASDEGSDDWQAWERLARLAPRGTPAHVQALGRLDLLARRLGARRPGGR
ncbi:helix-turn-helix domain-containing protein [Cellulomonas sp. URHE0023]|uniref:helix-turn-helix domain-containing protein n=1 Tax=Cellulomonas sp. URHE0023 TaxID=1380354 RepID=UPI00047FE1B3|nr:helix-turn-helix domain-containing protein [Cellulomonas sp. URHE0023]